MVRPVPGIPQGFRMTGREVSNRQRPMRVVLGAADDAPSLAALCDMGQDGQIRVTAEGAAA